MLTHDPAAMTIQASVGDSRGKNLPRDVEIIKSMLNDNIARLRPFKSLPVDSAVTVELFHMIRLFQKRVVGLKKPDGRVDPNGGTIKKLRERTASAIKDKGVPWLLKAYSQLGVAEEKGLADTNWRIKQYMATYPALMNITYERTKWVDGKKTKLETDYKLGEVDENPWCGCFVGWCLRQSGYRVDPKGFRAREWKDWGKPSAPRPGAICVIKAVKGKKSRMTGSGWHVGFWTGGDGNWLSMLGGNQTHNGRGAVCEKVFGSSWKIKAMRMPEEDYLLDATKAAPEPYVISDTGDILSASNLDRPEMWLEDSPDPAAENSGGHPLDSLDLGVENSSLIPLAQGTDAAISGRWFE